MVRKLSAQRREVFVGHFFMDFLRVLCGSILFYDWGGLGF
jgi:hypothetical protein